MKNSTNALLLFAICAGGIISIGSIAGEPPAQVTPQPLPENLPSPAPQATPSAPPIPVVPPAPPTQIVIPTPPSPVPFNAQNKEVAKGIYSLVKDIQESEFDPEKNLAAITKLQDTVAQTDFSAIPVIGVYIKDSLTLNTLRSKDIKTQRANIGKSNKEDGSKTGTKVGAGPFLNIAIGADYEKSNSQKHEDQNTTDVSISSNNDAAALDKTRQQQAISYGQLLNAMKHLGFSRPVDVKKIYGRWKWRCEGDAATYEFDFRQDGTVYVKLNADNPAKWRGRGFVNKGRGQWKLDYRSLTLELNDVNLAGFWAQHPLIFFSGKEIVSIDDDKMLLATDEDNELKRIADPSKK